MKNKTAKICLDYCSDIQEFVDKLPADCIMVKTGIMFTLNALRSELLFDMFSYLKRHVK